MAARASPAAHAETKLLTGPNNGPVEKGTPEGGQPMSTHNGGPTGFREGLKGFTGLKLREVSILPSRWVHQ